MLRVFTNGGLKHRDTSILASIRRAGGTLPRTAVVEDWADLLGSPEAVDDSLARLRATNCLEDDASDVLALTLKGHVVDLSEEGSWSGDGDRPSHSASVVFPILAGTPAWMNRSRRRGGGPGADPCQFRACDRRASAGGRRRRADVVRGCWIMGKATVFKPPEAVRVAAGRRIVFLAGSIEMGNAEDWQTGLTEALLDLDIAILNPRREAWDSSWVQAIDNPQFREQVVWELDGLARADVIAMYLAPGTRSPITLLELGLHAAAGKLVVCCPDGFWRKGNVDIVCARHRVEQVADTAALGRAIRRRLQ